MRTQGQTGAHGWGRPWPRGGQGHQMLDLCQGDTALGEALGEATPGQGLPLVAKWRLALPMLGAEVLVGVGGWTWPWEPEGSGGVGDRRGWRSVSGGRVCASTLLILPTA